MGLSLKETGLQYVGAFKDMFEAYKAYHNMTIKRQTFVIEEEEETTQSIEDVLR